MKLLKTVVSVLLVVSVSISCMGIYAFADSGHISGSDRKAGGDVVVVNSCDWTTNANNGWLWGTTFKIDFRGVAHSDWYGLDPYNADSITLSNTVFCDKIGGSVSFSAGVDPDGVNVGIGFEASSTSNSRTYSYSIQNDWDICVSYTYSSHVSGIWLHAEYYIETTSDVQIGRYFYSLSTGLM